MKRNFIFAAVLLLFFVSCESESYPDIKYTNTLNETVVFRTAEKDSKKIELEANKSMSLPSDARGRTQIASIDTPLVTWEYHGRDVYDIRFMKNKSSLEIRNYTREKIIVKEKNGYISNDDAWPVEVELESRNEQNFYNAAGVYTDLNLYTDKPVWIINPQKRFELKRITVNEQVKYILGIEPPGNDEEWQKL